MDRIWLKQYPPGVPAEVDVRAFNSLKDILATSCKRFADLPAYGNMGVSITYRELDALSRDFGAYLQKVAGLKKGDRIAIMMPNLLQYPIALFGAQRAGLTVVNTNPLYTPRELEHQLKDSGATAIVVLENFAHTLEQVIARTAVRTVITTQIGDMFPAFKRMLTNLVVKHVKKMVPEWHLAQTIGFTEALAAGRGQTLDDVSIGLDDVAFLQYTGGTTGVAKGAMLTQANVVANLQQVAPWIARDLLDGKETALIPLPLYHIFALTVNLVFMKIGAHMVLVTNPRDLPAFIQLLKKTPGDRDDRREHAVQRLAQRARLRRTEPACTEDLRGWRHGGAARGGAALEGRHRRAADRGLRPHRDVADRDRNPLNIEEWSGNIGVPIPSPRRRSSTTTARNCPSARSARSRSADRR
jgi:long-chain acyl-CoA synthetase